MTNEWSCPAEEEMDFSHPSKDIRGSVSAILLGRTIVVGITGSIAAVECVRLCRELIRYGAEVVPVMTPAATRIVHPDAIWFACGKKPVLELTGDVEHVKYCGDRRKKADLLLIAPATANTISKIAAGIDDTPVTTFATCAIGSKIPVAIAPAMHLSMYNHPVVVENIKKLREMGIYFFMPRINENKAKFPDVDAIVDMCCRLISLNSIKTSSEEGTPDISERRLDYVIVAGATSVNLDNVRMLTARASGTTGMLLARELFRRGYDIELLASPQVEAPAHLPVKRYTSVADLFSLADKYMDTFPEQRETGKGIDWCPVFILTAAISDFEVDEVIADNGIYESMGMGKIPSSIKSLTVKLKPARKLVEHINKRGFRAVLFKAESNIDEKELVLRACKRMEESGAKMCIANLVENVGRNSTVCIILVDRHQLERSEELKKSGLSYFKKEERETNEKETPEVIDELIRKISGKARCILLNRRSWYADSKEIKSVIERYDLIKYEGGKQVLCEIISDILNIMYSIK
ncbi:MAG: bifunctional phosphopantothenoylcysteine decarboxylase/phosphopantothenate--cysteine ligase CoaBC [Thermoplasmata archaeon]